MEPDEFENAPRYDRNWDEYVDAISTAVEADSVDSGNKHLQALGEQLAGRVIRWSGHLKDLSLDQTIGSLASVNMPARRIELRDGRWTPMISVVVPITFDIDSWSLIGEGSPLEFEAMFQGAHPTLFTVPPLSVHWNLGDGLFQVSTRFLGGRLIT